MQIYDHLSDYLDPNIWLWLSSKQHSIPTNRNLKRLSLTKVSSDNLGNLSSWVKIVTRLLNALKVWWTWKTGTIDIFLHALSLILYIPAFTTAIFMLWQLQRNQVCKKFKQLKFAKAANELGHNFDDHCSYLCFLTKGTTLSFVEILKHAKRYIHPVTISLSCSISRLSVGTFWSWMEHEIQSELILGQ